MNLRFDPTEYKPNLENALYQYISQYNTDSALNLIKYIVKRNDSRAFQIHDSANRNLALFALDQQQIAVAEALIEHLSDSNLFKLDVIKRSVLSVAVSRNYLTLLNLLITRATKANKLTSLILQRDDDDLSPLDRACKNNCYATAMRLLEVSSALNLLSHIDKSGNTPLHFALQTAATLKNQTVEGTLLVSTFVNRDASWFALNDAQQTPFDLFFSLPNVTQKYIFQELLPKKKNDLLQTLRYLIATEQDKNKADSFRSIYFKLQALVSLQDLLYAHLDMNAAMPLRPTINGTDRIQIGETTKMKPIFEQDALGMYPTIKFQYPIPNDLLKNIPLYASKLKNENSELVNTIQLSERDHERAALIQYINQINECIEEIETQNRTETEERHFSCRESFCNLIWLTMGLSIIAAEIYLCITANELGDENNDEEYDKYLNFLMAAILGGILCAAPCAFSIPYSIREIVQNSRGTITHENLEVDPEEYTDLMPPLNDIVIQLETYQNPIQPAACEEEVGQEPDAFTQRLGQFKNIQGELERGRLLEADCVGSLHSLRTAVSNLQTDLNQKQVPLHLRFFKLKQPNEVNAIAPAPEMTDEEIVARFAETVESFATIADDFIIDIPANDDSNEEEPLLRRYKS